MVMESLCIRGGAEVKVVPRIRGYNVCDGNVTGVV